MALAANSYGDVEEIAALVPLRAGGAGVFDDSTRPTLATVESETDQVSAMLNAILADAGFTIPVTQADDVLILDRFVNHTVAAIVEGINGSGRFGPEAARNGGRWKLVSEEIAGFVEDFMAGIERLGAARTYPQTSGVGYRDTDEAGDATFPIFQRKGFGNEFINWDS